MFASRRKQTISGKKIIKDGKRIKPHKARRIIRRFHFLIERRKSLCKLFNVEMFDNDEMRNYKNVMSFLSGSFSSRNNRTVMMISDKKQCYDEGWNHDRIDEKIERELLRLNKQTGKNDIYANESLLRKHLIYLGYVMREIEREGGLQNYQLASQVGQDKDRGGDSSKLLIKWIKELVEGDVSMSALEIGSLSVHNKISTSGLFNPVVRIDLNNLNDSNGIIQQDFMKRPLPTGDGNKDKFNLISCSLVLNFVPTPIERGEMCERFIKFLKPNGYLFIVLPLPCINNSRYMNRAHFIDLLTFLGYKEVRYHEANKVCYFLLQLEGTDNGKHPKNDRKDRLQFIKKRKVQDGNKMNNFSILLP
ncbi:25S rRNA (adenine2142-N1)-methyltransferase NDAI_0A06890 [Naumovozyma dairenensis CBS 421]|uniref:25S rRNA adenine-N(1) methyltransferase n=1 Tax=Naumovozyma dairenensis (strain ATCC 10597 / BCRC 20456 / CBS 421 / NBRC 0211 / NRRL Y-12639) TaxID=1071378 RepID=G0W4V5_NAUDC|nr:hypothetical protein NDAI_0A06890 [Naumovozyma dairenensis CBS 421]CCD22843.1 hypothetical protein NDAI_0A06890 [Naumovozyma dairenensis CBS 421]